METPYCGATMHSMCLADRAGAFASFTIFKGRRREENPA